MLAPAGARPAAFSSSSGDREPPRSSPERPQERRRTHEMPRRSRPTTEMDARFASSASLPRSAADAGTCSAELRRAWRLPPCEFHSFSRARRRNMLLRAFRAARRADVTRAGPRGFFSASAPRRTCCPVALRRKPRIVERQECDGGRRVFGVSGVSAGVGPGGKGGRLGSSGSLGRGRGGGGEERGERGEERGPRRPRQTAGDTRLSAPRSILNFVFGHKTFSVVVWRILSFFNTIHALRAS